MPISPRRAAVCAAIAALLAAPSLTRAETAAARVEYQATPPACPSAAAFLAAVHADTPHATPPAEGKPARTLAVTITEEKGHLQGRLQIRELDGTTSVREVTGKTCKEIASALALVTALAIDAGPSEALPPSEPPPPEPTKPKPKPKPPPPRPPPTRSPPPKLPAQPTPRDGVFKWEIGAHALFAGGLAPDPTWGLVFLVDRSLWERSGLAPSFRLGLVIAQSPSIDVAGAIARFRWIAGRFGACPVALAAGPVTLRPCGGLDLGALRGEGAGVAVPAQQTRFWASATATGRIQAEIVPGLVLEIEGGVAVPFTRDTFVFEDPRRTIHATPTAGGLASGGLGVAFE